MVTNRHVTITHNNATRRIKTKRGCPQGGVLSPFLWNLVIDDLVQYTAKHIPGYIQAFADDIMSLAEGDYLDVIWQRTQTTIKTIENWCQGLNISVLKTKIVMFTWNRKWSLSPIEVCGETIELSNDVKLLGIPLDSKLTFNNHIDNITKKCICTLFQCKRAIGPKGMPLDIHSNNHTHSSLVLSCGSELWRTKPTLNDWNESKEWLLNIWLAPCPRHRTQLLTISQEHPRPHPHSNPIHHHSSLTLNSADLSAQNQALSPCGIILTRTSVQVLFYLYFANTE